MPDESRCHETGKCDGEGTREMLERLLKVARILVHYEVDPTGSSPRSACDEKSRRSESDL